MECVNYVNDIEIPQNLRPTYKGDISNIADYGTVLSNPKKAFSICPPICLMNEWNSPLNQVRLLDFVLSNWWVCQNDADVLSVSCRA